MAVEFTGQAQEIEERYGLEGTGTFTATLKKGDIVRGTITGTSGTGYKLLVGNKEDGLEVECKATEISLVGGDTPSRYLIGNTMDFVVVSEDNAELQVSRRQLQEETLDYFRTSVELGTILNARVVGIKEYGLKLDIGRGVIGVLRYSNRYINAMEYKDKVGDMLQVVFNGVTENKTVMLSTIELYGDWNDNIAGFSVGDIVMGYVKKITEHGIFVTLTPNLSGLDDNLDQPNIKVGDYVAVAIKGIKSSKLRVRLEVVKPIGKPTNLKTTQYITGGKINKWEYEPEDFDETTTKRLIPPIDYSEKSLVSTRKQKSLEYKMAQTDK